MTTVHNRVVPKHNTPHGQWTAGGGWFNHGPGEFSKRKYLQMERFDIWRSSQHCEPFRGRLLHLIHNYSIRNSIPCTVDHPENWITDFSSLKPPCWWRVISREQVRDREGTRVQTGFPSRKLIKRTLGWRRVDVCPLSSWPLPTLKHRKSGEWDGGEEDWGIRGGESGSENDGITGWKKGEKRNMFDNRDRKSEMLIETSRKQGRNKY